MRHFIKLQRSEILIDAIGIWNLKFGIYLNYLIPISPHFLIKLGITNIRPVIRFVDFNPKFSQENIHIIILDFRIQILEIV